MNFRILANKGGMNMLMPAQLYKDELRAELLRSWYKPENIYWSGWTGDEITDLTENNYDMHCFVSIDKNGKVVGYISYSVNWVAMNADRFGIINFDKGNLTFAKDLYQAICDLFEKYHMNRIGWIAFADNPAIRGYRNFIRKHGGRECGYKRQHAKLQDGKLHDSIEFEILASEFKKSEINSGK